MPFWSFKKQKPAGSSQTAQSLADIARGMQHAVNSTQELMEQHYARLIERYFDESGKALSKKFILPGGHEMEVPLISLVPANGLLLKELTVDMSVRIDQAQVKSAAPEGEETHLTRASFQCSFAPHRGTSESKEMNSIDITMKFFAGDPPEGVARLMEYYVNALTPKKTEPKT